MEDAKITVVNFDQFELLLKYCVSWKTADPDTDSKFSSNDNQRFIDVDDGVLYIYEAGNATPIYASGEAPTQYLRAIDWDEENGDHVFTVIGGSQPTYSIHDVHLLDTAPVGASFLSYVSIQGHDFLIPQVSKPATGTSATYLDYLSVNGTEYKVSTFDGLSVRWNADEQYYDVSVVNNKGQLDLSFFARKIDIPTIPVTDVQTSTDGTTYTTVVDANKVAKINLSSFLTSSDISDMATQTWVNQQGFLTSVGWTDLTGTAPNVSTFNNDAGYLTSVSWSDLTGTTPSLSDFTNDLVEGNPTVPLGTIPVTLVNLKIGTSYFSIPQGGGGGGMTNPMTTAGDIIIGGSAGIPTRLGAGTEGQYLQIVSGVPSWASFSGLVDPTTTQGDILIRGTNGLERLSIGTNGQVLTSNGTTASWQTPSSGGEPAAYIKSISKSGRTLTWTNKDNTTDSLDTSYSAATQSTSGLMSANDKAKLDVAGELVFAGSISGSNHTDSTLSTSNVTNYRLMTIFVQPGYPNADTGKLISASFDPNVIVNGTTVAQRQNLESWNDEAHLYIYNSDGYIHCNLGSAGDCTVSRVVAYK